jgi:replicative DNA helicase
MNDAEKNIFRIIQSRRNTDFTPIKDIVMETLRHIDLVSKTKTMVTGIPTGFTDLDNQTAGLQNSDLILIAARPSMGKTSLMLNIAEHVALRENKCVALFSLEMPKEQIVNRLFSLESRVDMQKIRTGNLRDSEWDELIESAEVIGQSKLIIDDTPGITVQELRSKCRKFKLDFGLSLVIIDYLQQMGGSGKGNISRQQEISDISRALKAIARELQVPVIALSQLSRAVEQRPDHRPMLSDLRESGAIEQDADVVMFIYREEYYKPDSEQRGTADVIIAKQRNGPIGTVSLAWLPQFTRFANLERSPRE